MMESGGRIYRARYQLDARPAPGAITVKELPRKALEDWIPLRGESLCSKNGIDRRLNANVVSTDAHSGEVVLADGPAPNDRLLVATGADPVRLMVQT